MTDTSLHQPFETSAVPAQFEVQQSADHLQIVCSGNWDISNIGEIDNKLRQIDGSEAKAISIDTSGVGKFDTAGAWLIERLRRSTDANNGQFQHVDADNRRLQLAQVVRLNTHPPAKNVGFLEQLRVGPVETVGKLVVGFWDDFLQISNVIGAAVRGSPTKAGKTWKLSTVVDHQPA